MEIKIKDIKIGERYRKDMGDLQELVDSIKEIGLLQAVGVTENKTLIFGQRRIEACKQLGLDEIEARIIDLNDLMRGEQDENIIRKDFTMSERQALKIAIEPKLKEEAKERQGARVDLQHSAESAQCSDKTRDKAALILGIGRTKMKQEDQIMAHGDQEIIEQVDSGELSTDAAFKKVKQEKKKEVIKAARKKITAEHENDLHIPLILKKDSSDFNMKCDLLITDPPYMTDVENINEFVTWLPEKLKCVKDTGFAFIFIGAYPEELNAYLNIAIPTQVLVWTYKNTLGVSPKDKYKLNWQAILFYRMSNSPQLECPLTSERWSVHDDNAPDGRDKGRYHAWEKPLDLAEKLIRHTTKKGDIVFDCFAGTGTFLLAASKLGRRATGCETSDKMISIAKEKGCHCG